MTRKPATPDQLEQNVETLLGSAYDPPQIDRNARQRIRDGLLARAAAATPAAPARRWSRFTLAGAGLIAAAAVATFVHHATDRAPAAAAVRDGERVTLPDGTVAVLGDGGALDPLGARHVRVRGQVYLDVAPGQGTFTVETAHGRLQVLGTRFVVDAGADRTLASVLRGAVQLRSGGGDVVVRAGEQGTMRAGEPPTRGPAPRLSALASWAREARVRAEGDGPRRRSGTLYARDPQWQERDFPLPMKALTVDVVVENQVARVALDQTFHNPRPETLEGVYRFTTPPDAALARLAMYVEGTLMESAVVERMQARRIYEDIVYRRRDPALAEWTGAGRVDLRVFPLFGHQDKRLILAYTQALPRLYDDWTLTVPMPDLDDPVDEVALNVRIADCGACEIHSPSHDVAVTRDGAAAVVTWTRAGVAVGDSLVLTVRDPDRADRVATHRDGADAYTLVRTRPDLATGAPARPYAPRRWVILDDVSASRGPLERRAQADLIDRLVDTIDEDDQVAIATFDVGVRRHGPFVRAADVDRRAVRAWLAGERGGVGATDLGAALREAAGLLAAEGATAPDDAYVVYLGDGVVTGGARDLAALRAELAGKATFVAFAVGDGADTPSLGALADATGGLVAPIDPADDLGWRALDAIAALYTPRVVGVRARAVDAAGRAVEGAVAYLRAGQLAEGDEVEVVVRAPAGAAIAAIELDGTRDGAAWRHRVDLAAATRAGDGAGYLPRLWAQRHVQALTLARNTAPDPTPCAGEPCPTVEEQRTAYRERLRQEIVALGKRFFLLSPHTSLIVLENDAMYAQYGVTKGVADGWAVYPAPKTIPVPTGPAAPPSGTPGYDDVGIVRAPIRPFYSYDADWGTLLQQDRWTRTRGDLAFGTIGRGSGTGSGFGVGSGGGGLAGGLLGGEAGPRATSSPATGIATAEPAPAADEGEAVTASVTTIPAREQAAAEDADLTLVTTDELRGAGNTWAVGGDGKDKTASIAAGRRARSHLDNARHGWAGQAYPIAWNHARDWRLDDLTEHLPALFHDAVDAGVAELRALAGGATGRIDDRARALLDGARRAVAPGRYRWGDGPEITVDAAGRMAWQVRHDSGLVERATFDGRVLRRSYDELDVAVVRDLGAATPALYTATLPLVVPDPDHLARWYVVATKDDRTLTLAPASAPDQPVLELRFDADLHLVALRTASGRDLITIRWDRGAPVGATVLGDAIAVAHVPETVTDATGEAPAVAASVEVALPLRPVAHWRRRLAELAAGTAEWRDAQRQLVATLAATQDPSTALAALRELHRHGGLALGDLVLGSGGIGWASDQEVVDLLAAAGARGEAVGRYLAASRAYAKKARPAVFAKVADEATGVVAMLARHREVLALAEAGKLDAAVARLVDGGPDGVLGVIAAAIIAQRSWDSPRGAKAWDAVATGAWRNVGRYEAARHLYGRGAYAAAADRVADLLADYDLDAIPVQLDWIGKGSMTYSARGQAGWQLAWTAYRNRVLDAGDLEDVLTLLAGAMATGEEADVDRVLGRAAELAGGDPDAIAEIVGRALAHGRVDRAAPLLDAALAAEPTPAILRLGAQVAEQQGRLADAAELLDRALAAEDDGPVPLSRLRADLGRLLAWRGRIALLATGAARDAAVDAALDVSHRWREVDPDNAAIDLQVGELLLAAGRREEAWRQLSTAIERRPMEGDGWALVAGVMEKEGRIAEALDYWQQAIVIDQTNPTWRMRKAQALLALGRDAEGWALLEQVAEATWHDRWFNVTYQVQQMLQQRKAGSR